MSITKDYTAEDLQNAFDKGRATGWGDMAKTVQDLKDQLTVEKMSHKDMANVLNNYEEEIVRLRAKRDWVGLTAREELDAEAVQIHGVEAVIKWVEAKLKEKNNGT